MSKTNLAFRDNPQWNDLQLNNVLSFYWQVLVSLCLSVCSHQPCYFLLYKKANSLQMFSAGKSIHFYTFWCFIFMEVHIERLGMKPDVLEIIPRASANCALTINCFEQILPNGKLTDACLLTWVQEREGSGSVVAFYHWPMLWLENGRKFEEGESGGSFIFSRDGQFEWYGGML